MGCVEHTDMSNKDQVQHALFLGLAALLGEGVYNLGELVSFEIFKYCDDMGFKFLLTLCD